MDTWPDSAKNHLPSKTSAHSVQSLQQVRSLIGSTPPNREFLVEFLHRIQDRYRYISREHMTALARELRLAPSEVFEVATFYHHFDVITQRDELVTSVTVRVCSTLSCQMAGAQVLLDRLKAVCGPHVRVMTTSCVGRCAQAPIAMVEQKPVEHATPERVTTTLSTLDAAPQTLSYRFYVDYIAQGGYEILRSCHNGRRSVEEINSIIDESGLRGMGGAGFPAGRKWRLVRSQAKPRLIVANLDEGEPGTFKDRHYLESDPHHFLEGLLIAAWAISADAVYIYLRDEYATCREILSRELQALRAEPPCPLPPIHLRRGAGAYVCGEESAMIESIEGRRGMPRQRPPYVAQKGLFGRPTLVHNMETLYWVTTILEHGAQWYANHGRRGCSGLRSYSLSGRVAQPGVYVAPAGITARELVDEYGGGMLPGHELYGYLPGGASGGILPASLADIPLDFETLQVHGCFIGSAAIIVLSQHDCIRDVALNLMRFFAYESCGQCTPCRVGTEKAAKLLEQSILNVPLLEDLSQTMLDASICGLGQAAPNPIRCLIKYFPDAINGAHTAPQQR